MGRKGVSKRKTRQTKVSPASNDSGKGTPTSVVKVFEKLPTSSVTTTPTAAMTKPKVRRDSDKPQKGRNG